MFLGQFEYSVDAKGRITIPSIFRKDLNDTAYLTKGVERCILVYPEESWQSLCQKVANLSFTKRDAREFTRFFFANASQESIDAQGRILLPRHLREYASIDKKAIIAGAGKVIEIWSEQNWKEHMKEVEEKFGDIAEKIMFETNL